MRGTLDGAALDLIFRNARTQNGWLDTPVSDAQLHEIYEFPVQRGPRRSRQGSAEAAPA